MPRAGRTLPYSGTTSRVKAQKVPAATRAPSLAKRRQSEVEPKQRSCRRGRMSRVHFIQSRSLQTDVHACGVGRELGGDRSRYRRRAAAGRPVRPAWNAVAARCAISQRIRRGESVYVLPIRGHQNRGRRALLTTRDRETANGRLTLPVAFSSSSESPITLNGISARVRSAAKRRASAPDAA